MKTYPGKDFFKKVKQKKLNLNKKRRVSACDVMCANSQDDSDIMTKNTTVTKDIRDK